MIIIGSDRVLNSMRSDLKCIYLNFSTLTQSDWCYEFFEHPPCNRKERRGITLQIPNNVVFVKITVCPSKNTKFLKNLFPQNKLAPPVIVRLPFSSFPSPLSFLSWPSLSSYSVYCAPSPPNLPLPDSNLSSLRRAPSHISSVPGSSSTLLGARVSGHSQRFRHTDLEH